MVLYNDIILNALDLGYTADATGAIFRPDGTPVLIHRDTRQGRIRSYVRFYYKDKRYKIATHRFVAAATWGKAALAPRVAVEHVNDDAMDNRVENLRLVRDHDGLDENALRRDPDVQSVALTLISALLDALANVEPRLHDPAIWQVAEIVGRCRFSLDEAATAADLAADVIFGYLKGGAA